MNIGAIARRIASSMYWDPTDITSAKKEDIPKKVDELYRDVKKKNPDYDDGQAKATAWSIYCDSINPDSPHCKQEEYFKDRK